MANGFVPDEQTQKYIQVFPLVSVNVDDKLWKDKAVQGLMFDAREAKFALEYNIKYPWILIKKTDHEESNNENDDYACTRFDQLPTEMIQFILQYIDMDGLLTLARTCKFWKFHVRDSAVMQNLIER